MTQPGRHTADTITDTALDQLYAERDRYRTAWTSARLRAEVARHVARSNRRHVAAIVPDLEAATTRAEQLDDLLRIANDTSNTSETERVRAVERAERAEGAIERVRAAVHIADDHDVTDWQRGYRSCADRARAALDEQRQQPTQTRRRIPIDWQAAWRVAHERSAKHRERADEAEADRDIARENLRRYTGTHLNLQHDYHHALDHVHAMYRVRAVLSRWAGYTLEPGQVRRLLDELHAAADERPVCKGRGQCQWMKPGNTDRDRAEKAEADLDFWKQLAQGAREAESRRTVERDEQQTRAVRAEAAIERVRKALDDAEWGGPDRHDVITEIRDALDEPKEQPGRRRKHPVIRYDLELSRENQKHETED